jgi:hypothetical protein
MMTYNFGLVTVMAVVFALLTTFTVFVVLMLAWRFGANRWRTPAGVPESSQDH